MEPNTAKKTPEAPAKAAAPTLTKRVVVTIDAALAGDPLAAKKAAAQELLRQVKEQKEEQARKYARNLKTIEQAALSKMLGLFFPTCSVSSVPDVPGANNKVVIDALRLANNKMRQLRQQFVEQLAKGQTRDALATLEAAADEREGRCGRGGQGQGQKDGQEAGR